MIIPADLAGLQYVVRNMNAVDRSELLATLAGTDADVIAHWSMRSLHSYLYLRSDIPVSAFGVLEIWPRVWSVWMYSTDAFDYRAGVGILKHFHRIILPDLLRRKAHRVQCDSLTTHTKAHEFIQRFGGKIESTMKAYGRNGEDFYRFAWSRAALEAQLPELHNSGNRDINATMKLRIT